LRSSDAQELRGDQRGGGGKNKNAFGHLFPSPEAGGQPPYAQSFDGIGAITFICNSCSVSPPDAI